MNFLSHYYFDRYNTNSYEVLGSILPDLLKNADKSSNIFPEKHQDKFKQPHEVAILKGWKKHLDVDKLFHNASFFLEHQHQLKLKIKETLKDTPIKPFFAGHIAIELILDHLLLKHQKIDATKLYLHLNAVSKNYIIDFLNLNNVQEQEQFFKFFEMFKKEQYLKSYVDVANVSYALKRIFMRIWPNPLHTEQENKLTQVLIDYIFNIEEKFIIIFDEIERQLLDD